MLLWETEFYAVSVLTGEIEKFRGIFIKAQNFPDAAKAMRKLKFDYLQLTGRWFTNFDAVIKSDSFKQIKDDDDLDIKRMSFDDFSDWLENALTVDDLNEAREIVEEQVQNPKEYLKIIDVYEKRLVNGSKEENDTQEEET